PARTAERTYASPNHQSRSLGPRPRWLRQPSSRWVRLPAGIVLVIGGVFAVLPVLGLWMIPLGLLLLAQDAPFLRRPLSRTLTWLERRWRPWGGQGERKEITPPRS